MRPPARATPSRKSHAREKVADFCAVVGSVLDVMKAIRLFEVFEFGIWHAPLISRRELAESCETESRSLLIFVYVLSFKV